MIDDDKPVMNRNVVYVGIGYAVLLWFSLYGLWWLLYG